MMWKLVASLAVLAIAYGQTILVSGVTTADTPKCQKDLPKYYDCPVIGIDKNINQYCCRNLSLICVSFYDKHEFQHIYAECSEDMLVPKGCYLDVPSTGSGIRERLRTCEVGRYEPEDRMASEVRHNYCTETKTHCNKEGQQPLCQGGPAADDQCICTDGYHPEGWPEKCKHGFGENDICSCVPAECPVGTTRNINYSSEGMCDSQTISVDYNCHNISAVSTSSTQAVPSTTTEDKTNEESRHPSLLYLLFLIPFLLGLMFILTYMYRKPLKEKLNSLMKHIQPQGEDKSLSDLENAMLPKN